MTESTARAERFDVQTASSPFYLWEVPQKPVSVRIPFSLIDRLERDAVESFRSLTSRGSEIGGLLVGNVSPGSPLVVSIADYDLIACDYSRGPLYRLSDADMSRFEQAIQQRLASGSAVAGFFRSHTRKGISLDTDDLTFFQARFREPHHLALLVRPFATKASTAGIFIWENGKVNGEASFLEFPFRSSELGAGNNAAPPADTTAAAPSSPAPAPQAPKGPVRAQIVPIASRREISLPPLPVAEPELPAPPVAVAPPPPPPVEEKAPIVADKPAKTEKTGKNGKAVKDEKAAKTEASDAEIVPPSNADTATGKNAIFSAEAPQPAARGGKGLKLLLAATASIALFVALFVYPGFLRNNGKVVPPVRQDTSQLQLRVERANGELLLTWNPDSEAIRNASKASLAITDGDQHQNVDMDLALLASGRVMYSPSGTDISFKMEVLDKAQNKTTSESVRMLRPPSPLTEQSEAATKAAALPGAKPATAAAPPAATPDPNADPVAEQPAKPVVPLKQFKTDSLSQRLRPAAPTDMPDAPTVSAGDRPTASPIPGVSINPLAPAPPAAAPPSVSTPAAASKTKSGGQIQQAVLVYRKEAEYPKIAKQTGARGTVTINATIGADGNIKKVKVVSGHPMLANAAAEAVKQWRYRPCLLNGQPIESETTVLVNFLGDR